MRTSTSQFEVMVDFMERNGDLNKLSDGPNGRFMAINKWNKLSASLNLDTTGTSKHVDKWKKVWSDLKNNTKRKAFKIHRAASGTGGGPASTLTLTDLEQRVLSIIGTQAATGLPTIEEVGLELVGPSQPSAASTGSLLPEAAVSPTLIQQDVQVESNVEDWNWPGGSTQSTPFPSEVVETTPTFPTPHHAQSPLRRPLHHTQSPRPALSPRRCIRGRRRRRLSLSPVPLLSTRRDTQRQRHVNTFLETDEHWRNLATKFVTEHLRQREVELQQQTLWQTLWQTLFAKLTDVLDKYLNK